MATGGVAVPAQRTSVRSIISIAAAAAIVVGVGATLESIPGGAVPEQGAINRAEQAWAHRLEGLASRHGEIAIARQRADTVYGERLTAQADALVAQRQAHERATVAYGERLTAQADALVAERLAHERAMAAYGERLTRLAEYIAGQAR